VNSTYGEFMAIMKPKQIHEMPDAELKNRLNDLRLEKAKEKGQTAIGGTPSRQIKEIRRSIARILTEMNKRRKKEVM